MNVLFIASSSDWHIDLWVKYFSTRHTAFIFSDREDYRSDQPFTNVTVIKSDGLFGLALNAFKIKSHKLHQLNKLVSAPFYARKINALIRQHRIDIVHAHSLYYGFVASMTRIGVPVVFTPMGSDVILHAQSNLIYRWMAYRSFSRADIVTSDSLLLQRKGYMVGAKKENNYIIQNGVDADIFHPKKNKLKSRYGIKNDEILIFSPRGFTPIYNIDVIVETLHLLILQKYNIKCMFSYAFGGEYSNGIKEKISNYGLDDYIVWLGFLSYAEMAEHYNASDIVLSIPSSDSSPKSVYESMFCRKPVIISDLPWSYEVLHKDECVVRVPPRDSKALFGAVSKLIDRPNYARFIAQNGYEIARKHFSYLDNMREMEGIMLGAVRNGGD